MFNRITLVGRLTRDPELRYTPNGAAVTTLRLAVNERYRDRNGQPQEENLFIDVTVWGAQAETVTRYLRKGRLVLVDGRLRMETWQDRDGNNRTTYRVVARQVRFLDGFGAGGEGGPDRAGAEVAEEPAGFAPPPDPAVEETSVDENIPF